MGEAGSGHYVKMVHNGIEYADMQLITEAYDLFKTVYGLDAKAIADIFEEWNKGDLDSYLIEITTAVLPSGESSDCPIRKDFFFRASVTTAKLCSSFPASTFQIRTMPAC